MSQGLPHGEFADDIIRLDGRVAVVTGAAQGIGEATALTLANFGADVVVCDKLGDELESTAEAIEARGRRVVSSVMDIRDDAAVEALAASANAAFGTVDILVNNAGGGFVASFMDTSPKGQTALVNENFTQVTSCIRQFVPLMTAGGSIVNVTSIEAHRAGPGFGIYSAMKAAVASITKTLALELADQRIRVNCMAPDVIPTPGDAALVQDSGAVDHTVEFEQPWPVGGTVWDAAAAILFLASDLSRFVTGTTVHLDGGTHAASGWKRSDDGSRWTL